MLVVLIGLVSAIITCFHLCEMPSLNWFFAILIMSLLALIFSPKKFKIIFIFVVAFFFGFTWNILLSKKITHFNLPIYLISKTIEIKGVIASIPTRNAHGISFIFQVNEFQHEKSSFDVRLSWYGNYPKLMAGDEWKLFVRLKPPHSLQNPGGFDYQLWLFSQAIRATGYVVIKKMNLRIGSNYWYYRIARIRQEIQNTIQEATHHTSIGAILSALTVGSRSDLTQKDWQIFQRTGTSHLIAISGLHVGLIATLIYFFVKWSCRLFPFLLLRIPAPTIASLFAIIATIFYSLLAGLSLPTERAMIMIMALMLSNLLFRVTPLSKRIMLAFIIIILIHPFALFSASFWLSFMAVGCLMYCFDGRIQSPSGIKFWLKTQSVIFIGLFPLTLFFFKQVSLVMLLANLVAIPWIGMFIVPLCLFACCVWFIHMKSGLFLFWIIGKLLLPVWYFLNWLAGFSFSYWSHALPNDYILLASLIGILILLAPKGLPGKWLGIIWVLPLFCFRPQGPHNQDFWITLLDVGQGLSAVIRTSHHVLLYDAGPANDSFDAGQFVVLPFLKYVGLSRINLIMISHADNDHMGGVDGLLQAMPKTRLLGSFPDKLRRSFPLACYAGSHWTWDGVHFSILFPPKAKAYQGNNSSCVLRISNARGSVLLTGDIEKKSEKWLLTHGAKKLLSTVLVAPHHGSKTSSTEAFVRAVNAIFVLFPVGYYNRYRFPAKSVIARYRQNGASLYNTARDGAITIRLLANGQVRLVTARDRCYYWRS